MEQGPCNIVAFGYAPFGQLNMLYLFGDNGTLYIAVAEREIENREELQALRRRYPWIARMILQGLVTAEVTHKYIEAHDHLAWLARARFNF